MDRWLNNMYVVRVIALVLGLLLWAVVHMDTTKTTTTSTAPLYGAEDISKVSIETVGLDKNHYHLVSISPSTVTVRISGKTSSLNLVNTTNFQVLLDLSNVTEGAQIVPLKLEKLKDFPEDVSAEVLPSSVTVKVEKNLKKEMPVTIDLGGSPAEGLVAGTPIINPSRVHVTVPESRQNDIQFVRGKVPVDGAKSAVVTQVKLAAYNADGKEVPASISPSIVDVEVPITSPFKRIPLQIKLTGELPEGYSIAAFHQSAGQVTVYGPQKELDAMQFYTGPQIDLTNMKSDKTFVLDIPLKGKVTQVDPNQMTVELTIVPSARKKLDQVGILISGENNQYATKVTNPANGKIDLILEGAPATIEKMGAEDVQAFVDVSNLPIGKYELPLMLNLPPYVRKAPNQDLKVSVEISERPNPVPSARQTSGNEAQPATAQQTNGNQAQSSAAQQPHGNLSGQTSE
ncbi:CdaR family protein [Ferviditalea candida]|uniref:CdaR family protein n=1 Tax=Ferviditalea candida TaxID=3108399 RepID=A0ABU5ZMM1_9BACL|nr:CdaR family protein [Paenibacillaceae bacterium T2]